MLNRDKKQDQLNVTKIITAAAELAKVNGSDSVRVKFGNCEALDVPLSALSAIEKEIVWRRAIARGWAQVSGAVLSDKQFDALTKVARLQVGSNNYAASYRRFVKGLSTSDAARLTGIPYKNAWTAIKSAQQIIDLCREVAGNE